MGRNDVDSFIQHNLGAYQKWCAQEYERFYAYIWIAHLAFVLISINNFLKGYEWYWYLPSIALILLPIRVIKSIAGSDKRLVLHWDLMVLFSLLSSVFLVWNVHVLEQTTANAPILVSMLLCGMHSFHSNERNALIRNVLVTLIGVLCAFYFIGYQALDYLVQFIEGFLVATLVSRYLSNARRSRFYNVSLSQSQRYFAFHELSKIVPPHVVYHIEAGNPLETSMPAKTGNACVISFDIIASSQNKHPGFLKAVELVMIACHDIMAENYSPDPLVANAYRIKDTGDGFLCSVGFPYQTPQAYGAAELAVNLAIRFAEVCRERMQKLSYHEPIACAIGISQGLVEGFFPSSGVKQYDLRGRTLVLAKRYESMRNLLIQEDGLLSSSYLILQEGVFQNLPRQLQETFLVWDASSPTRTIRDDRDAKCAYFRRLPCANPPESKAELAAS